MDLKIINYCYYGNKSKMEQYNAPVLIFFCRDKFANFYSVYICDKKNLAPEMYIEKKEWSSFLPILNYLVQDGLSLAVDKEKFKKENPLAYITNFEDAPDSNYGEETVRLYTTFPWEVKSLRKLFTHSYLADIKWEKMCIEKMGLKTPFIEVPDNFQTEWLKATDIKELPEERHFYVPIKWVGWDIETNAEKVFPIFNGYKDAEKCDIISITGYESYSKVHHRFYWHRLGKQQQFTTKWHRLGEYYVPAFKKTKFYDIESEVINHEYNNEIDMLKGYIDWFSSVRPDAQFGFNSEGGYKISTKKGYSRKYWFNGFDMPYLYHRCKTLGLEDYIQRMSPLPKIRNGVKFRKNGRNISVQIEGVCQIDFIYTNEIFMYHKKFNDFREGNLQGYMSYFLGFGKVPHEEQIFEMWRDNIESDYDPTNPELFSTKKQENLVKKIYEEAKNSV